jgi:general secretion pathway protein E
MSGGVRALLGFALLCFVTGALIVAFSTTGGADAVFQSILARAAESLTSGNWLILTKATGFMLVLALVSTAAEVLSRVVSEPKELDFNQLSTTSVPEAVEETRQRLGECVSGKNPNIVVALEELMRGAAKIQASDLHLSPTTSGMVVTYRLQGRLIRVGEIEASLSGALATRVKVLARLDTHIRGKPQDGRLVMTIDGVTMQARVSTLPTENGERLVLRIVHGGASVPLLEDLGFQEDTRRAVVELLARPQGVIFVTGPVGSGKTTTLYSFLQHISRTRGKTTSLVTLEDPIELELPFATQTQMNARTGINFAGTLRSVLRQDPNVLMVGEIRDRETAEIAAQAGLTGHMILTTVHADNAIGPFARLMEMGVEPYVLTGGTLASISQRLVRLLCTHCRQPTPPNERIVERFKNHGIVLPEDTYYEPLGCTFCENEGFTGRAPIVELVAMDDKLRDAINARESGKVLYEIAIAQGLTTILEDGLGRARHGETSLSEVLRVIG